ncbi:chromosome condensation regulator RCC1 [Streptomyces sp. WM6372]|uniref:RCC1 domain-containing protein n=1 Tax=Streptomyces sp. WM6372 TaxID=1415555 RepID=UPI0006AFF2A7|nr:chromosome condensation regulator RCC1 [Streptomyces sp. WM6372]KOU23509.1 chromosome condensation regulator RCC1 [Streptomyces sp. WM6372]
MTLLRTTPAVALTSAIVLTTLTALTASALPAHAGSSDPWVRSWGANTVGQLGNGNTVQQTTPTAVQGIARADVQELSAGGTEAVTTPAAPATTFAIALLKDGTVRSWGSNRDGQLGNGTTTNDDHPAAVAKLSGISHVSAGLNHALAVQGGRVLSWGGNGSGQLGNGTTSATASTTPVAVQSLSGIDKVGAGCDFSVALHKNGTVWAWGSGADGRLGNGATAASNIPKQVKDLADVESISVGCRHVLARTTDGTVKAWGHNNKGQLGNDTIATTGAENHSKVPVDVQFLDSVAKVSATASSSFAILSDASVSAWGDNAGFLLGDRTTIDRTTPVPIETPLGVKDIAGSAEHTLAVLDNGSVVAWGTNAGGQLGNGSTTSSAEPVQTLPPGSDVSRVAAAINARSSFAY